MERLLIASRNGLIFDHHIPTFRIDARRLSLSIRFSSQWVNGCARREVKSDGEYASWRVAVLNVLAKIENISFSNLVLFQTFTVV